MKTTPNFKMDGGGRPHPGFDAIISKHGAKGGSHPGFDAIANKAKNRSMGSYGDAKTALAPGLALNAGVTPSKPASASKVALVKGSKSALSGVGTRGLGASGVGAKLGRWD